MLRYPACCARGSDIHLRACAKINWYFGASAGWADARRRAPSGCGPQALNGHNRPKCGILGEYLSEVTKAGETVAKIPAAGPY